MAESHFESFSQHGWSLEIWLEGSVPSGSSQDQQLGITLDSVRLLLGIGNSFFFLDAENGNLVLR